jgi:glycosyltransferase involved in cell wall biosynthesis
MQLNELNIVLPLYNPENEWIDQLCHSLNELRRELDGIDFRVILVNDGSEKLPGDIESLSNRFSFLTYLHYKVNMGKGHAIRYGISHSSAKYYIYTDFDFPFGHHIVRETYDLLKNSKVNLVIGTRDRSYFRMIPFKRRLLNIFVKNLAFLSTGFRISDTQAGLKGLDNQARTVLLETRTKGFIFELEFIRACLKSGLTFGLIDVTCRPELRFTNFRIKIISRELVNFMRIFL